MHATRCVAYTHVSLILISNSCPLPLFPGLDARAAATVMRAVRNVALNGRTVMVTIHQPSIEIFEAFDNLLLIQRGGRVTYFGPLGKHSCELIAYLNQVCLGSTVATSYYSKFLVLTFLLTSSKVLVLKEGWAGSLKCVHVQDLGGRERAATPCNLRGRGWSIWQARLRAHRLPQRGVLGDDFGRLRFGASG